MKVKEVFEKLFELGLEPNYWFNDDLLLIDPNDIDSVVDFRVVSDLRLKALKKKPFTEYDTSEVESNKIHEDIEEELKANGIDPEAKVDGYFVYYDTRWDRYYPLILVRNWKLPEKTHDGSNEPHLWVSVGWKYLDAGEISKAKIRHFFVSTVYPEENAVEIWLYWLLRGLADEFPDAVKEKHPLTYEVNLSALRDVLPAQHPWIDE